MIPAQRSGAAVEVREAGGQLVDEVRRGDDVLREAAVGGPAGELRSRRRGSRARSGRSGRRRTSGEASRRRRASRGASVTPAPDLGDRADDLVPRRDRRLPDGELSLDDVQVGPADAARRDADEDLAGAGARGPETSSRRSGRSSRRARGDGVGRRAAVPSRAQAYLRRRPAARFARIGAMRRLLAVIALAAGPLAAAIAGPSSHRRHRLHRGRGGSPRRSRSSSRTGRSPSSATRPRRGGVRRARSRSTLRARSSTPACPTRTGTCSASGRRSRRSTSAGSRRARSSRSIAAAAGADARRGVDPGARLGPEPLARRRVSDGRRAAWPSRRRTPSSSPASTGTRSG